MSDETPHYFDDKFKLSSLELDENYIISLERVSYLIDVETNVSEYIAGYVVRKLPRIIQCDKCLEATISNVSNSPASLITFKNRGGLMYPSIDTKTVCAVTELYFKQINRSVYI